MVSGKLRRVTTSHECPNCGANIRDDGETEFVRCSFCATDIRIARARRVTRAALEAERDQLLARDREWEARHKDASRRGVEDFIVPPIGCCGLYFALFVIGTMILSAVGLKESKAHGDVVAVVAISTALIGVVLIIWRRETRRRKGILALERERMEIRDVREERLREIEAELRALG